MELDVHAATQDSSSFVTLHVRGELDTTTVAQLCGITLTAMKHGGRHVLLDLDEVTACDSGSLFTILRIRHALTHAGGSLKLTAAGPAVRTALSDCGLDRPLPITHG